ncbi:MAG: hypothetical protein ACRC53_08305 [Plesiomonas sp.]
MTSMTPEFFQQLMLATLLADRCDENGTDYEESHYEHGVRDALQWVAGLVNATPHNPDEYKDLSMPLDDAEAFLAERGGMAMRRVWNELDVKSVCKTLGPTCKGCPDCGPVMGDATYQEMFGHQHDGV